MHAYVILYTFLVPSWLYSFLGQFSKTARDPMNAVLWFDTSNGYLDLVDVWEGVLHNRWDLMKYIRFRIQVNKPVLFIAPIYGGDTCALVLLSLIAMLASAIMRTLKFVESVLYKNSDDARQAAKNCGVESRKFMGKIGMFPICMCHILAYARTAQRPFVQDSVCNHHKYV